MYASNPRILILTVCIGSLLLRPQYLRPYTSIQVKVVYSSHWIGTNAAGHGLTMIPNVSFLIRRHPLISIPRRHHEP